MKVQASHYKGIDFVRLHDLPDDQQTLLRFHLEIERINILIDGKVVSNCIQFKDYSLWYTTVFKQSVSVEPGAPPVPVKETAWERV